MLTDEINTKSFILRVIFAWGHENIFEIKQKSTCTTVNTGLPLTLVLTKER